jgi:hypothetical protein
MEKRLGPASPLWPTGKRLGTMTTIRAMEKKATEKKAMEKKAMEKKTIAVTTPIGTLERSFRGWRAIWHLGLQSLVALVESRLGTLETIWHLNLLRLVEDRDKWSENGTIFRPVSTCLAFPGHSTPTRRFRGNIVSNCMTACVATSIESSLKLSITKRRRDTRILSMRDRKEAIVRKKKVENEEEQEARLEIQKWKKKEIN